MHDIISWGVWEKFGHSPVIGWMNDFRQILIPAQIEADKLKPSASEEGKKDNNPGEVIARIFEETVDKFASD